MNCNGNLAQNVPKGAIFFPNKNPTRTNDKVDVPKDLLHEINPRNKFS
jgi:hypothetical protein